MEEEKIDKSAADGWILTYKKEGERATLTLDVFNSDTS